MMKRLADPLVSASVVVTVLLITGFAVVGLAWRGVAANVAVTAQLPFLASGAIGGFAVIGFAAGVLTIEHRRWSEARHRDELDALVRAAAATLATARLERNGAPR